MSDLIRREDAIKALEREKSDWNCDYNVPIDNCIKRLKKVKSADRPQGEWVRYMGDIWTCSACGENLMCDDIECNNYCPHCGARMKGADDD